MNSANSLQAWDMTEAKDFEEFFASFNMSGVKYLIVGGYALALHSHPRHAGDMEVFVQALEENACRAMEALPDPGFTVPPLAWKDFTLPGRVFLVELIVNAGSLIHIR